MINRLPYDCLESSYIGAKKHQSRTGRRGAFLTFLVTVLVSSCASVPSSAPHTSTTLAKSTTTTVYATTTTVTTTTTTSAATPEMKFAAEAVAKGWNKAVSGTSSGLSKTEQVIQYVRHQCTIFDGDQVAGLNRLGRAVKGKKGISDGIIYVDEYLALIAAGFPVLCPQHGNLVDRAKVGDYPLLVGSGKYLVPDEVTPGTYSTTSSVTDCYWERTSADGGIIDNQFVSIAKTLTVTVGPNDGGFVSQHCGMWLQQR